MSSSIEVYGNGRTARDWLRKNYLDANRAFERIHPGYDVGDPEGPRVHGILEIKSPDNFYQRFTYRWTIPCHQDSGRHFKQTERDIRNVLKSLRKPRSVQVSLSPMQD